MERLFELPALHKSYSSPSSGKINAVIHKGTSETGISPWRLQNLQEVLFPVIESGDIIYSHNFAQIRQNTPDYLDYLFITTPQSSGQRWYFLFYLQPSRRQKASKNWNCLASYITASQMGCPSCCSICCTIHPVAKSAVLWCRDTCNFCRYMHKSVCSHTQENNFMVFSVWKR